MSDQNKKEFRTRIYGANVQTTNERCYYCNDPIDEYSRTVDHLIPESEGGIRAKKNKVWSCKSCNVLKDNMTPEQFEEHLGRLIRMIQAEHKRFMGRLKKIRLSAVQLIKSRDNQ